MKLSSLRKNCFRALICTILAMCVLVISCIPAQAATTYTKEALFSRFPAFLYNDESEKRVNEMVQAGVDILNAQSASDVAVAYLCTMINGGISFGLQEIAAYLSNVGGHGDYLSNQDQYRRDLAQDTLARMVNDSNPFISESNAAIKKFKIVKDTYKLANQAVEVADVCQYIDFSETNLTLGQATTIGEFVFSKSDGNVITVAGNAVDAWKLFVSTMELFEIEIDTIDTLIANVDSSSDLGIGLRLLKQDRLSDPFGYMATKYLTDYGIGELVGTITKLGTSYFENSGSVSLALTALKVFVKYGYVGAQIEDLIQAYMLYSNVNSMNIALANCRLDMINNGCTDGGSEYQTLYVAYLCAVEEFLDKCTDLTTPGEYNLKYIAESNLAALEDGLYISYDIHLKLCTEALNKATADGTLDENGQPAEVNPATNSSNLADRLAAIQAQYAPNSGIAFSERYGYSVGSFAFVQKVFNLLYGCNMPNTTQTQFRYQLYGTQNVETVGLLRKADMTAANVSELLAKAQAGDVLMGYGARGAHSIIIVGNNGTALTVYDCDSPYGPSNSKNIIQQYDFSYSDIFHAFSESSEERLYPGMALYRAVNRDRTYTDGDSIRLGDKAYFHIESGVLTAYSGYQTKVVIPDEVTRIGDGVFRDCENKEIIHEVVIPNSVSGMGSGVFDGCVGMVDLTIPANLLYANGFSECTAITHIKLTGSGDMYNRGTDWYLTSYYRDTPWYISSASGTEITIEIEDGITSIGNYEFYECANLKEIKIPDSVISIGKNAFSGCSNLRGRFQIPANLTSIGEYAFNGCVNLAGGVVIPNSVTSIGGSAFEGCVGITELTIPANIYITGFSGCTSISHFKLTGSGAMQNRGTDMYLSSDYRGTPWYISSAAGTEITIEIEDGITSIGNYEFCGCTNLREIIIPESVTDIGKGAFSGCTNLAGSFYIPNGMTAIGEETFKDCANLSGSVVIPDSVTSIGNYAFNNCAGITNLTIPATININGFAGCTSIGQFKLTGNGSMQDLGTSEFSSGYFRRTPWYISSAAGTQINIEIEEGITSIGTNEFRNCSTLSEISIPKSMTTIKNNAFAGCSNLSQVYFGGSEAQWNEILIESNNTALTQAQIHFDSENSRERGMLGDLTWVYYFDLGQIAIMGSVSEREPVYVAAYDENGKMISVAVITVSGGKATVNSGFDQIKLMWVDANFVPKCACVVIKASE